MALSLPIEAASGNIHDMVEVVRLQVDNAPAFRTNEVIMLRSIRVIMIHAVTETKTLYLAQICQQGKITVYGTKADIRMLVSDIHIHGIGSWMVFTGYQKIFDNLSLSAVFKSHVNSLKIGIITIMG